MAEDRAARPPQLRHRPLGIGRLLCSQAWLCPRLAADQGKEEWAQREGSALRGEGRGTKVLETSAPPHPESAHGGGSPSVSMRKGRGWAWRTPRLKTHPVGLGPQSWSYHSSSTLNSCLPLAGQASFLPITGTSLSLTLRLFIIFSSLMEGLSRVPCCSSIQSSVH